MRTDYAAFAFAAVPHVIFSATMKDNFLELKALRDGKPAGGGGFSVKLLPDQEPRMPETAAEFSFRTLPGFIFQATLMRDEVVINTNAETGDPQQVRAGQWINIRTHNIATGELIEHGGVNMSGNWG